MDKQWSDVRELIDDLGEISPDFPIINELGKYWHYGICSDIKRVLFALSRYKFVCKILRFRRHLKILECGCSEALGGLMLLQNDDVSSYTGIDFDEEAVRWNEENLHSDRMKFICGNFLDAQEIANEKYDAVISLDVIEHISKEDEIGFCEMIASHVDDNGIAIIGTPSIMMSPYASAGSRIGHVNLFDQRRLHDLLNKYFANVFVFNMNDEVVNTGFDKMGCYIFALCCGRK